MKRMLFVFICICLCIGVCGCGGKENSPIISPTEKPVAMDAPVEASDETRTLSMREQLGAPVSYQGIWTSNTSKTVARVNAIIEAPNAAFEVIEVARRIFTDGEIARFTQALFREAYREAALGNVMKSGEADYTSNIRRFVTEGRNADGNYLSSMSVTQAVYDDGTPRNAAIAWRMSSVTGQAAYNANAFTREDAGAIARGNSYTPEQARTLAEQVITDMGLDAFHVAASGVIDGIIAGADDPNSDSLTIADKQAYWFSFTRMMNGVPITYTTEQCNSIDDMPDIYVRPFMYETLNIVVSDDGLYAVEYSSPYEIKDALGACALLLPFDEICSVAKALLPLAYAPLEREGGSVEMDVERITLGYTRVQLKDAPGRYALVPAWDFFRRIKCAGIQRALYL